VNVVGSTIATPRTGEYIVSGGATLSHPSVATAYCGIYFNTVSNVPVYSNAGFPVAGGYSASVHVAAYRLAVTGAVGVGMAGQSNVVNGTWQFMSWQLIPVRVA